MTVPPITPVTWPAGKRAAAAFSFDLDAESAALAVSPSSADRFSVMSHQAYGPLAGLPRLLRMLERQQVRATFFVPGYTAYRHPEAAITIVDAGHEIAHHGYLHERFAPLNTADQAKALDQGLTALKEVTGVRPLGFRTPMWELDYHTPALLADRGFLYDSSLMDADTPYELACASATERSLVEIPVYSGLDDWEQYCFLPDLSDNITIRNPIEVLDMWRWEFEAFRREAGCFVLTSHPFLSGRPGRAAALEQLVEHVSGCSDVWVATLGEIAEHTRTLELASRQLPAPRL